MTFVQTIEKTGFDLALMLFEKANGQDYLNTLTIEELWKVFGKSYGDICNPRNTHLLGWEYVHRLITEKSTSVSHWRRLYNEPGVPHVCDDQFLLAVDKTLFDRYSTLMVTFPKKEGKTKDDGHILNRQEKDRIGKGIIWGRKIKALQMIFSLITTFDQYIELRSLIGSSMGGVMRDGNECFQVLHVQLDELYVRVEQILLQLAVEFEQLRVVYKFTNRTLESERGSLLERLKSCAETFDQWLYIYRVREDEAVFNRLAEFTIQ